MALNRREALQIAALGAVAAGCSTVSGSGRARPTSAPPESSSGGAPPADSPSAPVARRLRSAPEFGHGPRTGTTVALTFHGAGDPGIARAVFDELARARAHATVLAVGTWLDSEPTMAQAVLAGGHELGNHTQHHLPMRGLDAATALREIAECARTLHRLTGSRGRWFRASGTQHTTHTIRAAAAEAGYAQCLSYDVDSAGLD